jgi:hypothetical protein
MNSKKHLLSGLVLNKLVIFSIVWLLAPTTNAQSSPAPSVSPEVPEQRALSSCIGVGGALGLSENTTSLSEGGLAVFSKGVLNETSSPFICVEQVYQYACH